MLALETEPDLSSKKLPQHVSSHVLAPVPRTLIEERQHFFSLLSLWQQQLTLQSRLVIKTSIKYISRYIVIPAIYSMEVLKKYIHFVSDINYIN